MIDGKFYSGIDQFHASSQVHVCIYVSNCYCKMAIIFSQFNKLHMIMMI